MGRVPLQLKKLSRTYRTDRDGYHAGPEVRTGVIRAPAGTAPEVRKVFRELVRQLEPAGVLRPADVPLLIQLATALVFERAAAAELLAQGCTREDSRGRLAKHPSWQIWREAAYAVKSLSAEFGLSPASRSRIQTPTAEEAETQEFSEFVSRLRFRATPGENGGWPGSKSKADDDDTD